MSEQSAPTAEPPAPPPEQPPSAPDLPPKQISEVEREWEAPSVATDFKLYHGFLAFAIRRGGHVTVTARTEVEFFNERPPDDVGVFAIHRGNMLTLGPNANVEVRTNEVRVGDIFLQATVPSAAEYLAAIGTERMIFSRVTPNANRSPGQPAWQRARTFITIP